MIILASILLIREGNGSTIALLLTKGGSRSGKEDERKMEIEHQHVSTQVAIIGTGPAGLFLACLLCQMHIPCLLIEQHSRQETLEQAPRAGFLEERTTQLLRDAGLAERMMQQGHPNGRCEFRFDGQGFVLDYATLCQGRGHWVYPQSELIADLLEHFVSQQGMILFETQAIQIVQDEEPQVICHEKSSGKRISVRCDFVAGCDGFHGVSRATVPQGEAHVFEQHYGFDWLAVLANVAPSSAHTIYASHAHGFAGHLPRTSTLTRFYLQLPAGSDLAHWPPERIWAELSLRLAKDGWTLTPGPLCGCSLLKMRCSLVEPLYCNRLALLGDAAHLLTPAGAKGMNLALQDAFELAQQLRAFYAGLQSDPLKQYSFVRLPRIWRAQEFSHWMVETLNSSPSPDAHPTYHLRLQQARLQHLSQSQSFARAFAENYVGLSEPLREC